MTLNDYEKAAMRTAAPHNDLTNAALGLAGESGEFCDLLKKELGHGHPRDQMKMARELGDVLWYVTLAAREIGLDLETVARLNIAKLAARYPNGFEASKSINRVEEPELPKGCP